MNEKSQDLIIATTKAKYKLQRVAECRLFFSSFSSILLGHEETFQSAVSFRERGKKGRKRKAPISRPAFLDWRDLGNKGKGQNTRARPFFAPKAWKSQESGGNKEEGLWLDRSIRGRPALLRKQHWKQAILSGWQPISCLLDPKMEDIEAKNKSGSSRRFRDAFITMCQNSRADLYF